MTFKRSLTLALALGAVGLFFRLSIWSMAYDSATRLMVKPGLVLLFNLFFFLCAVALGLLCIVRWPRNGEALAPYASDTLPRRGLRLAAALCAMVGGGLLLLSLLQTYAPGTVLLATGGLMIAQGAVMLLLTLLRCKDSLGYASWLLLPAFTGCFFNIGMYQQLGAEPNPQVYMWPTLSMLCSAGAWVCYAGIAYQRGIGRTFALLAHLALLTLPVALAAPLPLAWRVYLCAPLLWFWAALLSLRAVTPKPRADEMPSSSAVIQVMEEEG